MEIALSDEDARTLRDFLHDQLRELRREIARTDVKEFRHHLVERERVVEHVLEELAPAVASVGR